MNRGSVVDDKTVFGIKIFIYVVEREASLCFFLVLKEYFYLNFLGTGTASIIELMIEALDKIQRGELRHTFSVWNPV